jgi:hypothetical protein
MRRTVDRRTAAPRWVCAPMLLVLVATSCGGEPAAPPAIAPATVGIDVYLLNETLGPPCTEVFPVPREADADDPVTGALLALLAGPTDAEAAEAYGSWFPTDATDLLLEVEVADHTVHVTFARLPELAPRRPALVPRHRPARPARHHPARPRRHRRHPLRARRPGRLLRLAPARRPRRRGAGRT